MPGNRITSICPVQFLKNILALDMSNNIIEVVGQKCFSLSKLLKSIFLNNNRIIYLYEYAFYNLDHLMFLNLSSNPLNDLPSRCFTNILYLKILNMQNIKFKKIQPNSFSSTNVKVIRTDDNKISCVSPDNSFSTSHLPWYISCSDILPSDAIKKIFKSISFLTVCLNSISILTASLILQKIKCNHKFEIIVIGLNFSDILCGIYLIGIWVSDAILKGAYLINDTLWKSHGFCYTVLCVLLWFTISNQIILFYFSISRLYAVIDPIKTREESWKEIFHHVTITHSVSFCLSVILTLLLQFTEKYLPTSLCSPFFDPSGLSLFTKVISWVVMIAQSIVSISIVVFNIVIINEVHKSKQSVKTEVSDSERKMISQLILSSTSNILCWIPANAVYISAMFLSVYPIDLVVWTTVMIMPINSIINPSVFIATHLQACFRKRKV